MKPWQYWTSDAKFAFRKLMYYPPRQRVSTIRIAIRDYLADWGLKDVPRWGNDRTTYIVGLFGSGRWYVNALILRNLGDRVAFFRDHIGFQPRPTSMIYSGHATIKHICRGQTAPTVTNRILTTVRRGFSDWIFITRHPIDSLITNWIWWRTYLRHGRMIAGISEVYKNSDDLNTDLDSNFSEFRAFAAGNPDFFATDKGVPFLSFEEFIEETELHLKVATLALRLEDFAVDPFREFSKITDVMSVNVDLKQLQIAPPLTKHYRFLSIKEQVPRFRAFIDELSPELKARVKRIGYNCL